MRSAFSPPTAGSTTTSSSAVIALVPTSIVRLAMPPFARGATSPKLRPQHKIQSCHLGYPHLPLGNLTMPGVASHSLPVTQVARQDLGNEHVGCRDADADAPRQQPDHRVAGQFRVLLEPDQARRLDLPHLVQD